jgi:sialate O-acetylesterase
MNTLTKLLLVAFTLSISARGEVKLPAVFADHMVLQCDAAVPVWGWAGPGERVTVEFAGQSKVATADPAGRWRVRLDPLKAGAEPRELKAGNVIIRDVLVGEVWVAGGQSNMGSPLNSAHNAAATLPQATDSQLRFFRVKTRTAAEPHADCAGTWEAATPDTAKNFSAVAYFFAQEIRRTRKVPVAVLQAPWGGTDIETWISLAGLKQEPRLTKTLDRWDKAAADHQKVLANPQLVTNYDKDLWLWQKEVAPAYNAAVKEHIASKSKGPKPQPARPEPSNPDPMGIPSPSRRPSTPTVNFNGMIAPLVPYGIRGVIWYQGENNGGRGLEYRELFPRLIQDWRARWGAEFPFLFVQLPGHGTDPGPVAEQGWPWLREAQSMTLREARTGMAITIDVGDPNNVHPADKLDVGHRLALLARRDVYGEKIAASGPLFSGYAVEGDRIRVRFAETGKGLTIGQSPWHAPGVEPLPMDKLIGFFIAGADREWVAADARIDGDSVVIASPAVSRPVAVRYGWASSPRCNLYNGEGLPASPFRTDDWPR